MPRHSGRLLSPNNCLHRNLKCIGQDGDPLVVRRSFGASWTQNQSVEYHYWWGHCTEMIGHLLKENTDVFFEPVLWSKQQQMHCYRNLGPHNLSKM